MSTLTVNPADGTGGATGFGAVRCAGLDVTWASLIAQTDGTGVQQPINQGIVVGIAASETTNKWAGLRRGFITFDTSSLGSSATITSAVLSLYGRGKGDDLGISPNIDIYTATPANNGTFDVADFDQVGSTSQTGSPMSYASFNGSNGWNDFTLNATGIANINKTGITKFSIRNANYDVAASAPGSWSNSATSTFTVGGTSDTGFEPKLVITYSTVVGPANLKSYNTNLSANIKSINTNLIANVKSLDTNT